jgi:hypothetical protein
MTSQELADDFRWLWLLGERCYQNDPAAAQWFGKQASFQRILDTITSNTSTSINTGKELGSSNLVNGEPVVVDEYPDTFNRSESMAYCVARGEWLGRGKFGVIGSLLKNYSLNGNYKAVVDAFRDTQYRIDTDSSFKPGAGWVRALSKSNCDGLDDAINPKCPMCSAPSRPVEDRPGEYQCCNPTTPHGFKKGRA